VNLVSIVIPCYNPGEWLLDAVASARAQTYPEIEIVLVDDGTDRAEGLEYIRLAATWVDQFLERVFEFLGHVEDMPPLIAAADIVLLPSRSEGVPLIVLESLAYATPVVASKVGALAKVVDESCGVLIEPAVGEASACAAPIDRLLNHPDICRKIGEAGRKKVAAEHDLCRTRQAYAKLFA
jgi:glycosyltransferase involved in cell wall biosynthesis